MSVSDGQGSQGGWARSSGSKTEDLGHVQGGRMWAGAPACSFKQQFSSCRLLYRLHLASLLPACSSRWRTTEEAVRHRRRQDAPGALGASSACLVHQAMGDEFIEGAAVEARSSLDAGQLAQPVVSGMAAGGLPPCLGARGGRMPSPIWRTAPGWSRYCSDAFSRRMCAPGPAG